MTKHSSKKISKRRKSTRTPNRRLIPAAAKNVSDQSLVSPESHGSEDGKLGTFYLEGANLADEIEDQAPTPLDVKDVEIVNETHEPPADVSPLAEWLRDLVTKAGQRLLKKARERVVVEEALNGTNYRPIGARWELQIVYFDTDPIAEDQFGRIFRQLLG